jgi:hypothetical protein
MWYRPPQSLSLIRKKWWKEKSGDEYGQQSIPPKFQEELPVPQENFWKKRFADQFFPYLLLPPIRLK